LLVTLTQKNFEKKEKKRKKKETSTNNLNRRSTKKENTKPCLCLRMYRAQDGYHVEKFFSIIALM
jgi:hypothetical protein